MDRPLRALALATLLVAPSLSASPRASAQCPDVRVDADLGGRIGLRVDVATDADLRAALALAARARATFDGGAELDALADLERAFELSGDASLAGMLGLSLKAAGRLPEAWSMLHLFLRAAPPDLRASLEARVRAALGELEAQLGGVRIAGDFGARGQVFLDGRLVAELPIDGALYLPPGHLRLEIRGDARLAQHVEVDVAAGGIARVDVDLPDVDADVAGRIGLRADPPRLDADLRTAAELWARARAQFEAGAELQALADLERALALSGDVRIAGMLGLALRAAGRLPEAWAMLHLFATAAPPDVRAALDARVRAALGELEAQLGGVRIDGDFGALGQVELDGRVVARLPFDGAIYLAPGDVRLRIRGAARLAQDLDVTVRAGAIAALSVSLPSVGADVVGDIRGPDLDASLGAGLGAAGSVPAPSGGLGFDPWPLVVVAGGLAVVLVIGGGIASALNDTFTNDLMLAAPDLRGSIQTNVDITTAFEWVGYLGAAVGATVAIVFTILAVTIGNAAASADVPDVDLDCDDDDDDARAARVLEERARREPAIAGACAPMLGGGLAGLGCGMTF